MLSRPRLVFAEGLAALVAFMAAAGVTGLVARWGVRWRLVVVPNPRSSHLVATPSGGGLGLVAGVLAGSAVGLALGVPHSPAYLYLLAGGAVLAATGLLDDFVPLPVLPRLAAGLAIGLAVAVNAGGLPLPMGLPDIAVLGYAGIALTAVWLAGVANFFNFMDGMDGLAAGQGAATGVGLVVAAWSSDGSLLGLALVAACLGFLIWNRPPARVVMGDVGSLFLGFVIAGSPLLATGSDQWRGLLFVALSLALFLLDPLETLARRVRGGHRIGVAHREHTYQHLVERGEDPKRVSAILVAIGFALAVSAAAAYRLPVLLPLPIALGVVAYLLEFRAARRVRLGHRPPDST